MARDQKTGKKRSKYSGIRYDRILILFVALVVIVTLIVLLITGLADVFRGSDDTVSSSLSAPDSTSEASGIQTEATPPEYETIRYKYSDIQKGNLILVNNDNEYTFPAEQEDENVVVIDNKTQSYTVGDNITKMNATALKAFNDMMDDFCDETGISSLRFVSGYRTKEVQDARAANADISDEVMGGFSEHNTGLCVDIGVLDAAGEGQFYSPTGDYAWITENCDKYGFILRYSPDKESYTSNSGEVYHFRYVGVPHAYYMKKNNLCLEEYLTKLSTDYKYGDKRLEITCYNKEYEVYYFAASFEGETPVYVPTGREYTVSGDNFGGFIVTAEK